MKRNWKSTLLWSVIAAAFIGPGTVTTATRAGSEGGWYYILPLVVAIAAGYLLMEMVARLTLVTGQSLGEIVRNKMGATVVYLLFVGVLIGCAAYQAGNLLGGLAGLRLFFPFANGFVLLPVGIIGTLLFFGNTGSIGRFLALMVLGMGITFLFTGVQVSFKFIPLRSSSDFQITSSTVLAIIGTTIVPYNFFLAAGISRGQSLTEMRSGLRLSFLVGGLITLGILLTGLALGSFTDFQDLSRVLEANIGRLGSVLLGLGLFAAGFSSAITAPLAAAFAGRTLLAYNSDAQFWQNQGRWFRLVWLVVLGLGAAVALLNLNIIGVIITAQIVNGLLVPFLAAVVLLLSNDTHLLKDQTNRWWQNLGGLAVFGYITNKSLTILAGKAAIPLSPTISLVLSGIIVAGLATWIFQLRDGSSSKKPVI